MAELALLRLLVAVKVWGSPVALTFASAVTDAGSNTQISVAIIAGACTLISGFITAVVALRRTRDPDISEVLALHDRVAVFEANFADLRDRVTKVETTVADLREDVRERRRSR